MKLYRCTFCLVVVLFVSVWYAHGQDSEGRSLANMAKLQVQGKPLEAISIGLLGAYGDGSNQHLLEQSEQLSRRLSPKINDDKEGENMLAWLGNAPVQPTREMKRSWNRMNAVWGKRVNAGGRNAGWTKFGGSWGKREPGWNNLKGLWGKRAEKWDKLASAWGKRQEVSQSF
ncbi:allatostatins MIP [Anopheles aquasalis]|uniref:allatostatins MIP n=1 Tax=Anopheles aquasalis TaxID=42839 RepID=UPI00215AFD16|nr:allatostatins MIP [Anopheles aquasalis]XP_050101319.1 allatostatins MIP [Anopheles aquasalis]XP_050101330.1 allatostatins MIP [Anopheles aquasalis]